MRTKSWTRAAAERTFVTVAEMLRANAKAQPLDYALAQIGSLAARPTPMRQLLRFAWVLKALGLNAASNELKPSAVNDLVALARAILLTNRVTPTMSKLSFLHEELHSTLSMMHASKGQPFRAAWERQVATLLARRSPALDPGKSDVDAGIRSLRLGHIRAAISALQSGEEATKDQRLREIARVARAKALWLSGDFERAASLLGDETPNPDATWLALNIRASIDGAPLALLVATRKSGANYEPKRILEAYLSGWCHREASLMDRVPRLRTLVRRQALDFKPLRPLFAVVDAIEHLYDSSLPLATRVDQLGDAMARSEHLPEIEHEALGWIAAARALSRSHVFKLARLCVEQYRRLAFSFTDGKTDDPLRVASDIKERDWMRE